MVVLCSATSATPPISERAGSTTVRVAVFLAVCWGIPGGLHHALTRRRCSCCLEGCLSRRSPSSGRARPGPGPFGRRWKRFGTAEGHRRPRGLCMFSEWKDWGSAHWLASSQHSGHRRWHHSYAGARSGAPFSLSRGRGDVHLHPPVLRSSGADTSPWATSRWPRGPITVGAIVGAQVGAGSGRVSGHG